MHNHCEVAVSIAAYVFGSIHQSILLYTHICLALHISHHASKMADKQLYVMCTILLQYIVAKAIIYNYLKMILTFSALWTSPFFWARADIGSHTSATILTSKVTLGCIAMTPNIIHIKIIGMHQVCL